MMNIHADKIIANKFVGEFENSNNNEGFNVGDIKWSATDLTQVGFLLCNGASIRKDTYTDLFNAIGTTYGSIDEEHFNLPNLIGRFIEGSEIAGGYKEAGLPNITGEIPTSSFYQTPQEWKGAFTGASKSNIGQGAGGSGHSLINFFDASSSNSIYGNSDTVQPNSVLLTPYIKAFKGASASSTDLEITKVANDVANKANMNLSNLSEIGRKAFFPSDTYVDIDVIPNVTSSSISITYNVPANGFISVLFSKYFSSSSNYQVAIQNGNGKYLYDSVVGTNLYKSSYFPVKKDDNIRLTLNNTKKEQAIFFYAECDV